jgi:hypothetical protein
MEKKAKKFDCVAMKRAAQRRIRARVRGLTPKQEIAFFRTGGAEFEAALAAARRSGDVPKSRRRRKEPGGTTVPGLRKRPHR